MVVSGCLTARGMASPTSLAWSYLPLGWIWPKSGTIPVTCQLKPKDACKEMSRRLKLGGIQVAVQVERSKTSASILNMEAIQTLTDVMAHWTSQSIIRPLQVDDRSVACAPSYEPELSVLSADTIMGRLNIIRRGIEYPNIQGVHMGHENANRGRSRIMMCLYALALSCMNVDLGERCDERNRVKSIRNPRH